MSVLSPISRKFIRWLIWSGGVFAGAIPPVKAATDTWTGLLSGSWNNAGNWSAGVPGTSDDVVFGGTLNTNVSMDGSWGTAFNSLTFKSGAGAFTLTGGRVDPGAGGIVNNSSNTQTINSQFQLGANQTWTANTGALVINSSYFNANSKNLTLAGNSAITINNAIANAANFTVTGSGNRTVTGTIASSSGSTVSLGGSGTNSFGAITGASTVTTSGTANNTINGVLSVASGGSVNLGSTGTTTVTGQVSAGDSLVIAKGTNNFTGSSTLTAATVTVSGGSTNNFAGQVNATTINLTNGTTHFNQSGTSAQVGSGGLNISGTANATFAGNVGTGGGININGSGNVTFNGNITSGSLTLASGYTGTTTLAGNGNNNITSTTVNGGTLILAETGGGDAINGPLTVNNGGTVIFQNNDQIPSWQTVTLNTGSTLLLGNTSQTFTNLVITGDSVIDFGTSGSQLNVSGSVSIANGITITVVNWNASAGDVFAGQNPGSPVVNIQYADSSGNVYATGTWGGGQITPGAPVPEPATAGLLIVGAGVGLFALRRPRRN